MRARVVIALIGVAAGISLLAYGLIEESDAAISIGDEAPDVPLSTLEDGAPADLAEFRGRWILVNFWSSWCRPCRAESPALQEFHDAHAEDGFAVVGVNLEDASKDARAFVSELGLTYPQLRATEGGELREAYGMRARPENFLLDPDGRVALIVRGAVTEQALRERIAPLIEGRS